MAQGRLPKDPEKRERRNAAPEMTELDPGARSESPPLPGALDFSERTLVWYEVWCRSPQAARFTMTDWARLHMLAPLVEAYFASPDRSLMAEIRLNEERLGATPLDRLRLRWRIMDGKAEDQEEEVPKPRRRRRDLRVVA